MNIIMQAAFLDRHAPLSPTTSGRRDSSASGGQRNVGSAITSNLASPMPRSISCGVIVRRAFGELLLGHATGRNYWDIPKGVRDNDETSIAAALRELYEEAGIELDELRLQDLGVHKYLPSKDLHLFLLNPPDPALDIELCHCSTHYMPRYGTREVPEIDAYRWTKRAEVPDLCGKNMTRVLMALEW